MHLTQQCHIKMQCIFQVERSGYNTPYTAMTYKDAVHLSSRTVTIARVQHTLYGNDIKMQCIRQVEQPLLLGCSTPYTTMT